ncbi:MAG: GNAT family N-acetyltransferase [Halodesulfurarchaeum sp.]
MEIRAATADDGEAIREIARASMRASYTDALSEDVIDAAVEEWYGQERFRDLLTDETHRFLVAEERTVAGFAEVTISDATEVGAIQWLHVRPDARGQGIGSELLAAAERFLLDQGATRIEGQVLTANVDGIQFYEEHGYREGESRTSTIAGETFAERTYLTFADEGPVSLTEPRETDDGTFHIALDEHTRGSEGDFYVAYRSDERDNRYGYYCDNCGSVDTAMDSMGRVACNDCGNRSKAERWDAAHM